MEHDHLGTSDQDPIGDPNCTFSSYTDFVQLLASQQPQYKWLLDFLIHATDGLGQNTKLFVADSENGCLVQKSIQPELLGQCPSSVKTRLVLIHYEEVWSIDRGLVDRVSLALNVPPYFLWQHFEHSSHNCERSAPNYRPIDLGLRRHIISPSQMFSLEIGDNGLLHMSSLLLMPSAACPVSIVLMLLRCDVELYGLYCDPLAVPGPKDVLTLHQIRPMKQLPWPEHFKTQLLQMDKSSILSADANPYEYACPFAQLVLHSAGMDVGRVENAFNRSLVVEGFNVEELNELSHDIQSTVEEIDSMLDHFSEFLAYHEGAATKRLKEVVHDYKALGKRGERTKSCFRDITARHVSLMALKESKKSIEQANSVKRLTQLASVFIPLSFSAGLFGMNVIEVQHTHLIAFVITAIITTSISVGLLWILSRPASISSGSKMAKWTKVMFLFSRYAPIHAAWLILFIITHTPDEIEETLSELGLYAVLLYDRDQYMPPENRFEKIKLNETIFGRFWRRKIEHIVVFTSRANWNHKCFWNRIFTLSNKDQQNGVAVSASRRQATGATTNEV